MKTETSELEEVFSEHMFGSPGKQHYKIKILMDIGREFTDIDNRNIIKFADALKHEIINESERINPEDIKLRVAERESILKTFGSSVIFVEEIANRYNGGFCSPWFVVTTKAGRITIGCRKRVICIDWSDSIINKIADDLFPDEDTTKDEKYIHAWGYDKATQYIATLLESIK